MSVEYLRTHPYLLRLSIVCVTCPVPARHVAVALRSCRVRWVPAARGPQGRSGRGDSAADSLAPFGLAESDGCIAATKVSWTSWRPRGAVPYRTLPAAVSLNNSGKWSGGGGPRGVGEHTRTASPSERASNASHTHTLHRGRPGRAFLGEHSSIMTPCAAAYLCLCSTWSVGAA